ncbi:septum formation initiator family protein [Streptomyces orinoci]|uniref:Septum formation initiator family protein n=1 Tax=Streptomyces orinoci TaxID=67339 RepID=A0ABV3JW40_STRON|nr:septum formation initiator family protein [Streptomyces orinoci]
MTGAGRLGRLLPLGPLGTRRTPFVLLVVLLLGSGLISLLLLNSSLNQGSFELSRLQRKTTELTDEQQALQQEVDQLAAPDALERRAREMGMVPGGPPAFLNPDGTVNGRPAPAGPPGTTDADNTALTVPAPPPPAPSPDPAPAATPAAPAPAPAAHPPTPGAQRPAPAAPAPAAPAPAGRVPQHPPVVPPAPPSPAHPGPTGR